jgi:predicted cation transporter
LGWHDFNFRFPEHQLILDYLGYIAVGAVLVVLLLGLVNMFRGGSSNTSQKLMRWRVGLQFVAIIILMLGLYLSQR